MKRPLLTAACAALLMAGPVTVACAPILNGPSITQGLTDEKALYAAEAGYFGAASAAEAAVDSGLLKGDRAAQVANALQTAYSALVVAREAHRMGNDTNRSTADVLAAVATAYGLIHGDNN